MTFYLGMDGGGSRTRTALCDSDGNIVARGEGGPANFLHTERSVLLSSVRTSLEPLLQQVPTPEIAAACIGMAGLGRACDRSKARPVLAEVFPPLSRAEITHDARIAWAGGLSLAPGIALISGTGSIAYGVDCQGAEHRAGGYGPHYSDEGGGTHLGRQAVVRCLKEADGRRRGSLLSDLVCARLGVASTNELAAGIAADRFSRQQISMLTESIGEACRSGDCAAQALVALAAVELSEMVIAVARQGDFSRQGAVRVSLSGGTFRALPELAMQVASATRLALPQAEFGVAALSPLGGALLMAMSAAGLPVSDRITHNLQVSGEGGF